MKTSSAIKFVSLIVFMPFLGLAQAQTWTYEQFVFTEVNQHTCSAIKNQGMTGTCWSFTTSSFLESELARRGKEVVDLSEMYIVRKVYEDKARNYILRQGSAGFGEGALAHDLIRTMDVHGLMTEAAYPGRVSPDSAHDHQQLVKDMAAYLNEVLEAKEFDPKWPAKISEMLDAALGKVPATFDYGGTNYTPQKFAQFLEMKAGDYTNLTSFSHHPFGEKIILELPDNYSNGSYLNVPLDEMVNRIDQSLEKGYTIAWDGDVSEGSFNPKKGIAYLPAKTRRKYKFEKPEDELVVTQENRQAAYESLKTTDDHLMHIVGSATDQNGTRYYLIKNSWGKKGPFDGYLFMSEAYLRMKTTGITLHTDVMN